MGFWKDRRVVVTGGSGFIGSYLVEMLLEQGAAVTIATHGPLGNISHLRDKLEVKEGDLSDLSFARKAFADCDSVFHLAALVRGVGFNASNPATMISENIRVNASVLEAARMTESLDRFLFTSSACGYPLEAQVPLLEEEFFKGTPEPSNAPYGWSKRIGEIECEAFAKQYGMKIAIVRPFNAYGPRDNFNPKESHVIPALIRKAVEKQNPFVVWGDGTATRAFIYCTDVARGMMLAAEKYAVCDALNLGDDAEVTIRDLVYKVIAAAGYEGANVVFDASKPRGQPRRSASIAKAREKIGFEPQMPMEQGLRNTVDWYLANKAKLDAGDRP